MRPPALEEIALVPENEPYWPTAVETWERRVQAVIDCGPEGLPPSRMLSPAERFLALRCLCRVHGEPYPEEEHVIGLRNLNLSPDGTRLMLEDDPGPCGLRVLERGVVVTATRLARLGLEWDRIPLLPGGVTLQSTDGTLRYPFSIPNWT